jgi:hypothetical protein
MIFRGRSSQHLVRAVSSSLVLTLALLLTPCCEILAAQPTNNTPATSKALHTQHDNGSSAGSGERCTPWPEQAFIPADEAVSFALVPPDMDVPLLYRQPSVQLPHLVSVIAHVRAAPPTRSIYLLNSRFLL